jgi:hypothetical protein
MAAKVGSNFWHVIYLNINGTLDINYMGMKKPYFTIENVTGKPYFKVEDEEHIYFIPDRLRSDVEAYIEGKKAVSATSQPDLTNWYLALPMDVKSTMIVAVNKNIH